MKHCEWELLVMLSDVWKGIEKDVAVQYKALIRSIQYHTFHLPSAERPARLWAAGLFVCLFDVSDWFTCYSPPLYLINPSFQILYVILTQKINVSLTRKKQTERSQRFVSIHRKLLWRLTSSDCGSNTGWNMQPPTTRGQRVDLFTA